MSLEIGPTDQEIIRDGRKGLSEKRDGAEAVAAIEAPLIERSLEDLCQKLEERGIGERVVELWNRGNSQRAEWLQRRQKFLLEYDEFVSPIYSAPISWSSTMHFPTSLTLCKTYHARMFAATMGIDPPFTVKARKEANTERAMLVQELMRYTLKDWANCYRGIEEPIDAGIWAWVTEGSCIWKPRWEKRFVRFKDVESVPKPVERLRVNPQTGVEELVEELEATDQEVDKVKVTFDGPQVDHLPLEDVVIVGGEGEIDRADAVIEQSFMTASELNSLVDQRIFRKQPVEVAIESGRNRKSSEAANSIKTVQSATAGSSELDPSHESDRYQVLEAHLRTPIDDTGIDTDVIVWVHAQTKELLRATYLHRLMPTGERPYAKADFHKRRGQTYGVGLIELTYTLCKEIDAMRNMRMDFGLLSSMPFGYYRPTSSMSTSTIPIQPGQLVPLDNPQADVNFPVLGNRTVFGFQEEAAIQTTIERFTGISDLSLGVLGAQGAARTATGARALIGESNANLDIYLRRLNRALKKLYSNLFALLQKRLPNGFAFRVFGSDGRELFPTIESKAVIEGMFDFELDPSSANTNKQIQIEVANQIYQMTQNPIDLQLGIVTPLERYEAVKNVAQTLGVKDYSRFFRKPQGVSRSFSPQEIADRILAGLEVVFTPDMDLKGFAEYVQMIVDEDELLGQFSTQQAVMLVSKQVEAMQMLEAMSQMAAAQANAQQMQRNASNSTNAGGAGAQPGGGVDTGAGMQPGGAMVA